METKPNPDPDPGTDPNPGQQPSETKKPVPAQKAAQDISAKTEFRKIYGCKAFSLNAKLNKGDGSISYVSKQPSVAAVDKKTGKVTIKGTGIAKIVITASETNTYREETKTVTIKASPKKVTLTEVKSKAAKKAVLKWKKTEKASGYQIQYATNSKFRSLRTVSVPKGNAKTKSISKLKRKKTYYFRIRAYKKSGNTVIYGAYSKVRKVKVK